MQPAAGKGGGSLGRKKTSWKRNKLGIYEHASFSMELWKKAFKDACEQLCPIRSAGHECGCLSAPFTLVCCLYFFS